MSAIRYRILPSSHNRAETDRQRRQRNKGVFIAAFTLPGLFLFLLFVIMPIVQSVYFSMYRWNGFGAPTDFRGLDNYTHLLNDPNFMQALAHSFAILTMSVLLQLPFALGLALVVGRGKLRGKRIFRAILFIPYVFSEVITALIWQYVMHPTNGLLNVMVTTLIPGFQPVSWLAERSIVLVSVFVVLTWKYFGFYMILYMAGLQSIPSDLEDAARVDGGTERQVLQFVTLPMLASTIRLTVFLSVLGSFQQFVLVWVLTQGGPVNASELIATYLYKYGITRLQLGFGSAVAVVLFAISLVFSIGYQRIIMKREFFNTRL